MTQPEPADPLGPLVDIWIEDTPGGQALFVTTTDTNGDQATAALWQPANSDQERDHWPKERR